MAKPKRSRTERRELERALRKEVVARERLAAAAPGGAQDRPIVVATVSVIESMARSTPCVQCGGELELKDHAAPPGGLRLVRLVCRLCHAPREIWFSIEPPLTN
ncbi:MAG TPA: hypothetical protein VN914_00080 [Polyangia bacterium]|nr:hypothetical protein [Polyangia bacterium]